MRNYLVIISIILFFTALNSFAAFTINSISGVSFADPISGTAPPTVYGGIAGTCTATTPTSTCNSCGDATTPARACNLKSVHPGLVITVSFTSSTTLTNATVNLKTESSTAGSSVILSSASFSGTTGSLTTTWGAVCASDGTFDSSCLPNPAASIKSFADRGLIIDSDLNSSGGIEDSEKVRARIKFQYVDATVAANNGQAYSSTDCTGKKGACGFTLTPGDEKLFVNEFIVSGGSAAPTNDTGAPDWQGLVFLKVAGAAVSSSQVANNSSEPIIKLYDATYDFADSSLASGFENYIRYCLIMGNMNKAQNIYYFTTANDDTKTCATPSEVFGILDDKSCFISTAAFGSDMASEVQTFRKFRNEFLLSNATTKKLVSIYYKLSPPLANFISESEFLKSTARAILLPLLIFAKVALAYGLLAATLCLLMALILLNQVSKFLFRHKKVLPLLVFILAVQLKAEVEPKSEFIKHPAAKDGLIKIKKDGSYIYDVKYDLKNESSHIRFGQASQPQISILVESVDSNGVVIGENTLQFEDFYEGASDLILSYDYEWYPWVEKNMFGLQLGVGLMYADGRGRLKISQGGVNPLAEEKYSFLTVPLSAGVVYRLQWTRQPWLAPYAAGGGTYVGLAEKREDKSEPNFAGGFGFYGAGGVLVNLSKLNAETAFDLNSEYGIGNLWFSLEYKVTEVSSDSFSFRNRYLNGGISFDF